MTSPGGCGGHARSVIELIESSREWQIQGLVGWRSRLESKYWATL